MAGTVDVTRLLGEWRTGHPDALSRLLPAVYGELRQIARRRLAGERPAHTLQPTALVHEVYLRLADDREPRWQNRRHFFAVAGRLMQSLLIDHARARTALKRGGRVPGLPGVDPGERRRSGSEPLTDLIALEDGLQRLAAFDRRKCRTIQLRYLAGLTIDETAAELGVSTATVILDTRLARAWLHRELSGSEGDGP